MKRRKMTTLEICQIGIFTAIIAVLAQISIPMPYGVPMTLQTFAIPLAGIVLGSRNGTIAATLYVLMGIIGLPVFTGFTGGLGIILGPTGGFILSFPIVAYLAGIGAGKSSKSWLVLCLLIGTLVTYSLGIIVFSMVTGSTIPIAFTICVLPFIPVDILKIILAGSIGAGIRSAIYAKKKMV